MKLIRKLLTVFAQSVLPSSAPVAREDTLLVALPGSRHASQCGQQTVD